MLERSIYTYVEGIGIAVSQRSILTSLEGSVLSMYMYLGVGYNGMVLNSYKPMLCKEDSTLSSSMEFNICIQT